MKRKIFPLISVLLLCFTLSVFCFASNSDNVTDGADLLTDAEAKAKTIRAEGDAEAARHYEVFKANPELAAFLRKLDSLRRIMKSRTTLVLDTGAAPFDLLNADAAKLGPRAR